jgi:hypothetical protein
MPRFSEFQPEFAPFGIFLGNQALQSLWVEHSDMEVRQRQSFGLEVPTGEESGS